MQWYFRLPGRILLQIYPERLNEQLEKALKDGSQEVPVDDGEDMVVIKLGDTMKEYPNNADVIRRLKGEILWDTKVKSSIFV